MAYLIRAQQRPAEGVFESVRAVRHVVDPNLSYWCALKEWERRVLAAPSPRPAAAAAAAAPSEGDDGGGGDDTGGGGGNNDTGGGGGGGGGRGGGAESGVESPRSPLATSPRAAARGGVRWASADIKASLAASDIGGHGSSGSAGSGSPSACVSPARRAG